MSSFLQNIKNFLHSYWIIMSIGFASLLLRLYGLGVQSVWIDEVISLRIAMRPLWFSFTFVDPTPPVYYALFNVWQHIFQNSLMFAYLFSVLAGVALVVVMYFFVKRYFSHKAAIVCAVLTAINPAFVYYSQEIRTYSFLFLIALLAFYAYWNLREQFSRTKLILFGVCALMLLYTHIYGAVIVFAIVLDWILWYVWLRSKNKFYVGKQKNVILWTIGLFGLLFVMYLPWLIRLKSMISIGTASWIVSPSFDSLWYLARAYVAGHIYSNFYLPAILLFAICIVVAIFYFSYRVFTKSSSVYDARMFSLSICGALTVLIPFFASLFVTPFFVTRYALVSLVFFVVVFSVLLSQFSSRRVFWTLFLVFGVTCLFVSALQTQIVLKDDWRSVSDIVIDYNIPVMVTPVYNALAIGYYVNETCLGAFDKDEQIYDCLAKNNRIHTISHLSEGLEFEPDAFLLVLDQRINTTLGADEFMSKLSEKYDLTHIKTFQSHTSKSLSARNLEWFDGNSLYKVEFSELYVILAERKSENSSLLDEGAR